MRAQDAKKILSLTIKCSHIERTPVAKNTFIINCSTVIALQCPHKFLLARKSKNMDLAVSYQTCYQA